MMAKNTLHIKKALQGALHHKIEEQLASLRKAISSIEESKLNETKSSAGDKFETGRAMMQMEQDKTESQLAILNLTKNKLKQISPDLKAVQPRLVLSSTLTRTSITYQLA